MIEQIAALCWEPGAVITLSTVIFSADVSYQLSRGELVAICAELLVEDAMS